MFEGKRKCLNKRFLQVEIKILLAILDNEFALKKRGGRGDDSLDKSNTCHTSIRTRAGIPSSHIKG